MQVIEASGYCIAIRTMNLRCFAAQRGGLARTALTSIRHNPLIKLSTAPFNVGLRQLRLHPLEVNRHVLNNEFSG
jgi:hypothetical protein